MEEIILAKLDEVKKYSLLGSKEALTFDEACLITGFSKSHLYKLTASKQIPHYKPTGKYIFFNKTELQQWLMNNRVQTTLEAEQQATAYVVKKGGAL